MSIVERLTVNEKEANLIRYILMVNLIEEKDIKNITFNFDYDYKLSSVMNNKDDFIITLKFKGHCNDIMMSVIKIRDHSVEIVDQINEEVKKTITRVDESEKDFFKLSMDVMEYGKELFKNNVKKCFLEVNKYLKQ